MFVQWKVPMIHSKDMTPQHINYKRGSFHRSVFIPFCLSNSSVQSVHITLGIISLFILDVTFVFRTSWFQCDSETSWNQNWNYTNSFEFIHGLILSLEWISLWPRLRSLRRVTYCVWFFGLMWCTLYNPCVNQSIENYCKLHFVLLSLFQY